MKYFGISTFLIFLNIAEDITASSADARQVEKSAGGGKCNNRSIFSQININYCPCSAISLDVF